MKHMPHGILLFSGMLATLQARGAEGVTVHFDDFATVGLQLMGNSPGSAVPTNSQLSTQYQAADGITFSSTSPYVAIGSFGTTSPPAGIGGVTASGQLSYNEPVKIVFSVPGASTPAVTTSVSITGDQSGIGGQTATFTAYDANGAVIQAFTKADTSGLNNTWTVSGAGIHSVIFSGGNLGAPFGFGTGIALDDLQFDALIELLPGDADADGRVDLTDLNTVLNHLGTTDDSRKDGNFDGAATIDLTDLNDVLNNLGIAAPPIAVAANAGTAAPEPASLLLGALPAALLLRRRK
jgi:hypothetical protein